MRRKSILLACAAAMLLAGCGGGEYYEKTPQQVTSALKSAYLPVHLLGSTSPTAASRSRTATRWSPR